MSARDLPIRRARTNRVVDRIGAAHGDAQPIEQSGEMVELTFRLVPQPHRHPLAAK